MSDIWYDEDAYWSDVLWGDRQEEADHDPDLARDLAIEREMSGDEERSWADTFASDEARARFLDRP